LFQLFGAILKSFSVQLFAARCQSGVMAGARRQQFQSPDFFIGRDLIPIARRKYQLVGFFQ